MGSETRGKQIAMLRKEKGVKQEENIDVTLVLITHSTTEGLIMDSIDRLYDLKTVKSIDNIIRIEDFK